MNQPTRRAGIIPYYIKNNKVYMLFQKPSNPDYGGPDLQIAKGRIDPGETSLQTAIREGHEEIGLRPSNYKNEPIYIGCYLTSMDMYIVEVEDQLDFDAPHFETGETRWMTIDDYKEEGRPLHLPIVQIAYNTIMEMINE